MAEIVNIAEIVEYVPICLVCHKRPATKRCDFPIGTVRYVGHGPKLYSLGYDPRVNPKRLLTCNKPVCDRCSVKYGGFDFCRNHKEIFENG